MTDNEVKKELFPEGETGDKSPDAAMEDLARVREYFKDDAYATHVTGIEITEVAKRYAKVELDLDDRHRNAMGAVMGGVYFTMSDFAFAIASNFDSDPCVTLGSHITYLTPAKGQHLIAKAKCRKDGRRTCCYEVLIWDELDTEVATVIIEGYKVIK